MGRILAYLEAHGRVESVAAFLARSRRGKVKRRVRRPYAQRKPKTYTAHNPGNLIQVDTLTVSLGPGEVIKHFSAVDLATRFSLAEVHTRATANLAAGFLAHLVAQAPFPVKALQVDGGSELQRYAYGVRWRSLRRPANAWAFGSSCYRPSVPS